jgi:hypothetical protein
VRKKNQENHDDFFVKLIPPRTRSECFAFSVLAPAPRPTPLLFLPITPFSRRPEKPTLTFALQQPFRGPDGVNYVAKTDTKKGLWQQSGDMHSYHILANRAIIKRIFPLHQNGRFYEVFWLVVCQTEPALGLFALRVHTLDTGCSDLR